MQDQTTADLTNRIKPEITCIAIVEIGFCRRCHALGGLMRFHDLCVPCSRRVPVTTAVAVSRGQMARA